MPMNDWRQQARSALVRKQEPKSIDDRMAALIAASPAKDVPLRETVAQLKTEPCDSHRKLASVGALNFGGTSGGLKSQPARHASSAYLDAEPARPGVGERKMFRKHSIDENDLELQIPPTPITRRQLDDLLDRLDEYDADGKVTARHGGFFGHVGVRIGRVILRYVYEFKGEAFPSLQTIAERAGSCVSSVVAAIKKLVEAGFLNKVRRRKTVMVERQRNGRQERFTCDVQASNLYRARTCVPSLDNVLRKEEPGMLPRFERRISSVISSALNQTSKDSVEAQLEVNLLE